MRIARVALDVPRDTLFDYLIEGADPRDAGRLVVVPFGKKQAIGVIAEIAREPVIPEARLRRVTRVLRELPALTPDPLGLLQFCSDYYRYPFGQTVASALPARLRDPRPIPDQTALSLRITEAGAATDPAVFPKRSVALRRLFIALKQHGVLARTDIAWLVSRPAGAVAQMIERGLAEEAAPGRANAPGADPETPPPLTSEQEAARDAMTGALGGFHSWLLHGVTGSGKTEVYLGVLDAVLGRGRQALILAPEINLTPQLEARFRRRFPRVPMVSLHSGLNAGERLRGWLQAASGEARVVLGTRLAVFTPMPDLGLVVVDEEHDASYKQEDGLRYCARDVAVFRAHRAGIPVILGSATPSLESLYNAERGRYRLLRLTRRAAESAVLPTVSLVDIRGAILRDGLSRRLLDAIGARLGRGEQSLVFINRRGYAPALMCPACRWISPCPRCSGRLVLHLRDARLLCHHCGHTERVPSACPGCGNQDLRPVGHATQRVESALVERFPAARIARIDRDTTRRRGAWQQTLEAVREGRIDILVGTQILSKGHDFEGVSLVGVLNPDGALYSTDFRASERLFAQLIQVAGRAGRGAIRGEVLVQTQFPDHPLYQALCRHDFDALSQDLLEERRIARFPPFVHQAVLRAEAPQREAVQRFLQAARRLAGEREAAVEVFDPVPALLARIAGLERGQLLVQSDSRAQLQRFLADWQPRLTELGERSVRWAIDVDPLES
jgi:primosomal protein N' (replication factor Y) (superfamily II helicase)